MPYKRSRPGYPEQLLDTLIAEASVQAGDSVVDFGAGTGIFTELLVSRQFDVTAVDPNEDMMRQADPPDVRWINGTFEENSLPDRSQDWAVAAQAFHWADPDSALPQVRRILRPNSVFTIIWNNRSPEDNEIVAWTEAAIHRHVPEFDEAYRNRDWASILESTGDFTFLSHHSVLHSVAMSNECYLELWRSHNRLNNTAGLIALQPFSTSFMVSWTNDRWIKSMCRIAARRGRLVARVEQGRFLASFSAIRRLLFQKS